jgi:protein SCO1/2
MTRSGLAIALIGFVGMCPQTGCQRADKAEARPSSYALQGVVHKVDRPGRTVTVAHEAIPGFMPAMTMPLRVAQTSDLDDVEPGDEVEGRLVVGGPNGTRLEGLTVTKPALASPGPEPPTTPVLTVGQPVPDFDMTDQDGRPMRLSDLRGHAVVLTFVYTRCPLPEFCPAQDRKFADLARRLAVVPSRASAVCLLSVSFDPEHDTPEALARHAASQGARPPVWRFAVASHDELARVAPGLGLSYGPLGGSGGFVHDLSTAVIGPDGRLARLDRGGSWDPSAVLASALEAAGAISPTRTPADSGHGNL